MSQAIPTLPATTRSARTAEEMADAVETLSEWPTLEAIPPLARLDRRANGWIFSLISWLAVTAAALLVIACLLLFWSMLWAFGIMILADMSDYLHSGLGIWLTVAAIAGGLVLLYRDQRLHKFVDDRLRLYLYDLPRPLRWVLQAARGLIYLIVVLILGGVLAALCAVVLLTALDWLSWLAQQPRTPGRLLIYFGRYWPVGLGAVVLVTLAVLGLRSLRRQAVLVAVGMCVGSWGVLRLVQATNALWPGWEPVTVGVLLGLAALYPSRWPFRLAQPMALPLRWLSANGRRVLQRLRLRRSLWQAVRRQRRQNVSRTGKKWRLALCQTCLARLESQQERLAYRRRLRYARCRNCHSDQLCYQGVRRVQGWLDSSMTVRQEQVEDTVRVNLLSYLQDGSRPLPLDLDQMVVADATDHQVEAFLTLYAEKGGEQLVRPFGSISYGLHPAAAIGPNIRAMLHDTFAKEEQV